MPEWIGKTIGKVRIEKYLARGGMAEVYFGTHSTLDIPVAVKLLHSHIEEDRDLLARFQREAKVIAGLRHPNIVQIYDFDTSDGHPYIVMEYLKGPTLATYLRELHERNQRLSPHQVARLLKVLTSALDYAHGQGVIHRDIKPGNILLHTNSDTVPLDQSLTRNVEAILTDFGLVRIMNSAIQTMSGSISGTAAYMSPEQARGDQTDKRTDIYSLGVVLYEMLAGRVPFEADTTMSVLYMHINEPPPPIPGASSAIQTVMDRALAKDPNDRYQTSQEMAIDFYRAIGMNSEAETIIETLSPEPSDRQKTNPRPAWMRTAIFSFLALLVVAFGGFWFLLQRQATPTTTETTNPETVDPTATSASPSLPDLPVAEEMVEIAAGTYELGTTPADEYHSPGVNITLSGFWIDKYQITFSEYQQYLLGTGGQSPEIIGEGNHPVRGVTWDQAVAYCTWANKRLPNEAEWEAAGRGPGPNPPLYPWGSDATANGSIDNLPDQDTYEVGTLSFNVSSYGVFDMVGNIWEWVDEPYADIPAGYKVLRGGRFGLPILDLAYRLPITPDDDRYIKFSGFRCAADQVR
jgi:serine/threonine protein kinase